MEIPLPDRRGDEDSELSGCPSEMEPTMIPQDILENMDNSPSLFPIP